MSKIRHTCVPKPFRNDFVAKVSKSYVRHSAMTKMDFTSEVQMEKK